MLVLVVVVTIVIYNVCSAKEKSKMMNYYLVMINARSGGQDGPQLLDKFREVVERGELNGELVSLTDPRPGGGGVIGPGPALRKHRTRNKLRIIGKLVVRHY